MSRLLCRGSIALAAVAAALLWSRPAVAQVGYDPGPPRESGTFLNEIYTGVYYDRLNQAKAERRLQKVQEKYLRDAQQCDPGAAGRDARRIESLTHRIAVDEWLIRQNSLYNPGCYPHALRLDPISRSAIAQAARPAQGYYPPQMPSGRSPIPPELMQAAPVRSPTSPAPLRPMAPPMGYGGP